MFRSKEKKTFQMYKKRIEKSGLFDAKYYLQTYKDARLADLPPLDHFIKVGLKEDRRPNKEFDPVWYRENYKDVKENKAYPFIHYIIYGKKEGRFSNEQEMIQNKILLKNFMEYFDEESYLIANPDIKDSIKDDLFTSATDHFQQFGYLEVKNSIRQIGAEFPLFNEISYLEKNFDVQKSVKSGALSSGFEHFLLNGYINYKNGNQLIGGHFPFEISSQMLEEDFAPIFNEESYLRVNTDVLESVRKRDFKSGWEHFKKFGLNEVRLGMRSLYEGLPKISEEEYVEQFNDVREALSKGSLESAYWHYLLIGNQEILKGERIITEKNYYSYTQPLFTEKINEDIENLKKKIHFSIIIPVYNVDVKWLDLAIQSIKQQWYPYWEICIVDDKSTKKELLEYLQNLEDPQIKIRYMAKNSNISAASNEALKLATGEYIVLMDNDDELTPDALYEVAKVIDEQNAEFIYSDEDKIDMDGRYSEPHYKADFAPDMFLSQNYISHLGVIKKELVDKVRGWEIGLEGSQDYDLYLKILEQTDKIYHIPKVLYHWRKIPGSTASEYSDKSYAQEAGRKALESAMLRRNIEASVLNGKVPGTYKVSYTIKTKPLVSIIIPFKDKPELLKMSIESILNKSTYNNFEIIGMSNNSQETATFEEMQRLRLLDDRVQFYEYNVAFNYSKINNYAVKEYAKGEHIILLNNDIEIITPNWIEEMLIFSQRKEIGAVGAKLYYPDTTIQHAGVILGIGGVAGHSHKYFSKDANGYFSRLNIIQNVSAVTAACLMVKKSIFEEVNGLNENDLTIAFNDVDFCLRIRENGYLNIFTPYCEAYHHESISRGAEDNPEKVARFNQEVDYMKNRYQDILEFDPYYNENLTLIKEDFSIKQGSK